MKPFEEYQAEVRDRESIDRFLLEVRSEVRALVEEEVERAGVPEDRLRAWVQDQAREEMARQLAIRESSPAVGSPRWMIGRIRLFVPGLVAARNSIGPVEVARPRYTAGAMLAIAIATYGAGFASGFWASGTPTEAEPAAVASSPSALAPVVVPPPAPDSSGVTR